MPITISKTQEINNLTKSRAYKLQIYSFSAPKTSEFPAFLKDFTDSFKSSWDKVPVYGRMDPISTFKNTTRVISVSFDIPNDSIASATVNLEKLDGIIQGLYPVYDGGKYGTATISSPPMFRVRFANLIRNIRVIEDEETLKSGLLCFMDGFDFKPVIESGFFVTDDNVFPKLISVNMTLNIIHEHPLGNEKTANGDIAGRKGFINFPHLNTSKEVKKETEFLGEKITETDKQTTDKVSDAANKAGTKELLNSKGK